MSKIYDKYLELKEKNQEKLYLFKSGKFYIFVGDDVDKINEYVVLKKTNFTKDVYKCGFPDTSLEDYLRVFGNQHIDIEIINSIEDNNDSLIDKIKK